MSVQSNGHAEGNGAAPADGGGASSARENCAAATPGLTDRESVATMCNAIPGLPDRDPVPASPPAASPATLRPGTVCLFHARLDPPRAERQRLETTLSPEERARAARFHFEADRRRAAVSWGLVRTVLAGFVGRSAASLRFERTPLGKPMLPDGPSFNLSHSGDHFLLAVAAEGRLGVDLEVRRALPDLLQLATRNFDSAESAGLATLPPTERERAFFRIWTCKEAFVKALGSGLYVPLTSFCVTLPAGSGRAGLRIEEGAEEAAQWSVFALGWDPAFEAAVAWDRPELRLVWLSRAGG